MKKFFTFFTALVVSLSSFIASGSQSTSPSKANEDNTTRFTVVPAVASELDLFKVYFKAFAALTPEDGEYGPYTIASGEYLRIAPSTGYEIASIKDQYNKEYLTSPKYPNYIYYESLPKGDVILTVYMVNEDAERTATLDLTVDGEASDFRVLRGNDNIPIKLVSNSLNKVPFNPATENSFQVASSTQRALYKVELNGKEITADQGVYDINNVKNGDQLFISSVFPDLPVKVNLTGSLAPILAINVNNVNILTPEIKEAGYFTCKLGDFIALQLDRTSYNIEDLTLNGDIMSLYASYWTATTEEYTVNIKIEELAPKQVTVVATDYQNVNLYQSGISDENLIPLTGRTTEIEIPFDVNTLFITTPEGWVLNSVLLNGNEILTSTDPNSVTISGIEEGDIIEIDNKINGGTVGTDETFEADDENYNIFSINGMRLKGSINEHSAGIYIINGKKIVR